MENLKDTGKLQAIEQLTTWSKWLITINFLGSTGCVIALKSLDKIAIGKVGAYLFLAVLFFALYVPCATIFTFCMVDETRSPSPRIRYIWLAKLQWLLFSTGLLFLIAWISVLSKVI